MAFFGPTYPREVKDRAAALDAVPGQSRAEWDPFYAIDRRFYTALRNDNETDRFAEAANAFLAKRRGGAG
jgi:hypothetical protein